MGKTLEQLKAEALEATTFRGHTMDTWTEGQNTAYAECKCRMYVHVDTKPLPNGIDIGGDAVALNCTLNV